MISKGGCGEISLRLRVSDSYAIRIRKRYASDLAFIWCPVGDVLSSQPSVPAFVGITAGTHNFEWSTPHACPKEPLGFSALEEGEDTTPPGDGTPPEGDSDGGQELVDTFPAHHTARNLMIAFAVAS